MTISHLARVALAVTCIGCAGAGSRPAAAPAPALSPRAALQVAIDSMVALPQWRNAHWGILVVDPARGDTLYSRNAGKLFMPASNMKIVTGAVALEQLGADYRFRTVVAARRDSGAPLVRGGELQGDLVVIGHGDPTVSDHMFGDAMLPLLAIADSLVARGVRRVSGRLVADGSALPGPELGFGWSWDDLDYPYSAGVSALYFNEGFTRVVVRGGTAAGQPATVQARPALSVPVLVSEVQTVARPAGGAALEEPELVRDALTGRITVQGVVAEGDSVVLSITYANQQRAYLLALQEALHRRGIVVAGGIDPRGTDRAAATDTLFTLFSPPLRDILPRLEKPSQNQIAELFFRALGLERASEGSADSGRRVVESQLRQWGVDTTGFVIRDGSGLSRHNYLSPETLVRVLAAVQQHPEFPAFYESLPVAGVDGTIANRMRGTAAAANVRAKTGYIDRARSLSGYVTTADGTRLVFSVLCNNWTVPTRQVEQVQDSIAARLAAMTLR